MGLPITHRSIRIFALLASICLALGVQNCLAAVVKPEEKRISLPPISYTDANAMERTINFAQAKLTIVHFWATWCVPCVEELPKLDTQAQLFQAEQVQVVAISVDGKKLDKVVDFYTKHNIKNLEPALDEHMNMFRTLEGKSLPFSVLVDSHGQIVARINGPAIWDKGLVPAFIETYLQNPS